MPSEPAPTPPAPTPPAPTPARDLEAFREHNRERNAVVDAYRTARKQEEERLEARYGPREERLREEFRQIVQHGDMRKLNIAAAKLERILDVKRERLARFDRANEPQMEAWRLSEDVPAGFDEIRSQCLPRDGDTFDSADRIGEEIDSLLKRWGSVARLLSMTLMGQTVLKKGCWTRLGDGGFRPPRVEATRGYIEFRRRVRGLMAMAPAPGLTLPDPGVDPIAGLRELRALMADLSGRAEEKPSGLETSRAADLSGEEEGAANKQPGRGDVPVKRLTPTEKTLLRILRDYSGQGGLTQGDVLQIANVDEKYKGPLADSTPRNYFPKLVERGLVLSDQPGYVLTDAGRTIAVDLG